ncbi:hypothetical protein FPRO04_00683 [Fusarium proliferatum]|nr:hypothetical protein FPRO03_00318 [Fusarium proliferatum]KAG4287140.1 hypothetical protein FPRO04_00683 [Fusarium proliferatum]CVK83871.1 uncharacterized protein FPRN_01725 [Fusarium proliferatum]
MESISYDVDPDGDIELILRKPNKQKIVPTDWTFIGWETNPGQPEFTNPPCLGRYKVFSKLSPGDENHNPEAEVCMRVSSRHLTLASRVFRAMLQGPWIEAALSSQPIRQISTEGWDALALAIVLDCIHGRHFEIPTQISPGLLTRISTIVDCYQCREAVQVHYRTWTDESVCRLPNEQDGDGLNVMWLFVSWVFHDENRFRKMADRFVRLIPGISDHETHELPVSGILEKLDDIRETLCNKIFEALDALQEELMGGGGCDEEDYCNAVLLPILIAERDYMQDNCASTVEPPFDKCQLQEVLGFIDNMTTPVRADFERENPNPKKKRRFDPCFCTIQGRLKPTLDEIDREARSIRLADFQPK